MNIKDIIIKIISFYQKTLSPDHGLFFVTDIRCRFYPSCSEYTKQSIGKYGVLRGISRGLLRIIRCNPLYEGGVDHP